MIASGSGGSPSRQSQVLCLMFDDFDSWHFGASPYATTPMLRRYAWQSPGSFCFTYIVELGTAMAASDARATRAPR